MDELTLDDELYLSTKRAAKITGYAKDYVGQLCREGRVKARLVGRNWYVLDSSIREHRFGSEESPESEAAVAARSTESSKEDQSDAPFHTQTEEKPISAAVSDWQAQYVAEPETEIPVINESEETSSVVREMQSAWQDWFKRRDEMQIVEEAVDEELLEAPKAEEAVDESPVTISRLQEPTTSEDEWLSNSEEPGEEEDEVSIAINRTYTSDPKEVPVIEQESGYARVQPTYRRSRSTAHEYSDVYEIKSNPWFTIVRTLMILAMLAAIIVAVLGTGYFDFLFKRDSVKYYPLQFLGGQSVLERK